MLSDLATQRSRGSGMSFGLLQDAFLEPRDLVP